MRLGYNRVDRVRLLRKFTTRLRGTNYCTSSARIAPSFVRQLNGAECTQIVRNAPKRQFRVQWVDRVRSLRTILMRLHRTTFCTSLSRFAPSFVRQPNGLECTQTVRNAPKHQFRVQWGGSGAFVVKNSDATSCKNFCTSSARFAPSFITQPNGPQCTQIKQKAPKH